MFSCLMSGYQRLLCVGRFDCNRPLHVGRSQGPRADSKDNEGLICRRRERQSIRKKKGEETVAAVRRRKTEESSDRIEWRGKEDATQLVQQEKTTGEYVRNALRIVRDIMRV